MVDVLSTGLSALRATQRGLDTTSHNIANVSTEGYTRQRVEFQSRPAESSGSGWIGTGVHLVRYEDLVAALRDLDSDSSEAFFTGLFNACGIERPDDWRERVLVGSDRKQSGTARENLTGSTIELPSELPEQQKQIVDFAAAGLRSILGYE